MKEMRLTKMNRLSDATLNRMTKKMLIEYVRMCEHNYDIAEETLRQQAENVKDWRPVKYGYWKRNVDGEVTCSYCEYVPKWDADKFCAGCGAKMVGDDNG